MLRHLAITFFSMAIVFVDMVIAGFMPGHPSWQQEWACWLVFEFAAGVQFLDFLTWKKKPVLARWLWSIWTALLLVPIIGAYIWKFFPPKPWHE